MAFASRRRMQNCRSSCQACTGLDVFFSLQRGLACTRSLLFFLNQDHQLKSSPAGLMLYLVGDSDACVEIDSTPLLKPSSRGPLRGGSQDMATTYKMGHLDHNSLVSNVCLLLSLLFHTLCNDDQSLKLVIALPAQPQDSPQDHLSGCACREMARLSIHKRDVVLVYKVCP